MPDSEAARAFHTPEAPKSVEATSLTPGLRCRLEIFDISFPDYLLNATTFRSAKSHENVIQMIQKERDGQGTGH
jgi:hypothetical protein